MNNLPAKHTFFPRNTNLLGDSAVRRWSLVGFLNFPPGLRATQGRRLKDEGRGGRPRNRGMETKCEQKQWILTASRLRRIPSCRIWQRPRVCRFTLALFCRRILSVRTSVSPSVPGSTADTCSYNILPTYLSLQGAPVCSLDYFLS